MELIIKIAGLLPLSDLYALYFTSSNTRDHLEVYFDVTHYWSDLTIANEVVSEGLQDFVKGYCERVTRFTFMGGSQMSILSKNSFTEFMSNFTNVTELNLNGNRYVRKMFFVYAMPNLRCLDISGCVNVDDITISVCLPRLKFLKKLVMRNLPQARAMTYIRMCTIPNMPALEYLDGRGSGTLCWHSVRFVLWGCPRLLYLDFDPTWLRELSDWAKIPTRFPTVTFGNNVISFFPEHIQFLFKAKSDESEEEE